MIEKKPFPPRLRLLAGILLLCFVGLGAWGFLHERDKWPRGEALRAALEPLINRTNTEQAHVASIILDNFQETRTNASRWSGIYWGCTFAAAALSALAGLILKFEIVLKNDGLKKDVAAVFAVSAALLITISSSGDFQRKWQANRVAAAELERTGYELLEKDGTVARSYLAAVGRILLTRNMAIVGGTEPGKPPNGIESSMTREK